MAGLTEIKGYQIIGSIVRRDGVHHALFGGLHRMLGDAMTEISRLNQRHGACWVFNVRGLREGSPVDILAGYNIRIRDTRPCKLYAVEASTITADGLSDPVWRKVWGRSAAEARANFTREHRRQTIRDVVELTLSQETALEKMELDPVALSDRLEGYAVENSLRRL